MNDDPSTIKCPNCGAMRPAGIVSCSNCGFGNDKSTMTCPNCKSPKPAGAEVCWNCGYRSRGRSTGNFVVWLILFILIGVPAGCLGACSLLMGPNTRDGSFFFLGFLGMVVFVTLLVVFIRSTKK